MSIPALDKASTLEQGHCAGWIHVFDDSKVAACASKPGASETLGKRPVLLVQANEAQRLGVSGFGAHCYVGSPRLFAFEPTTSLVFDF